MLSRSLMMRLWSQEATYDLNGLLKEMENRYRHRSRQALRSLWKRIGRAQTNRVIDEAITNWKRSGAWRQDVWGKPSPELEAIKKRIQELEESPPTDHSGLTAVLGSLQNYMESLR
jgi:DNA-binding transcriptional regulator PaaX